MPDGGLGERPSGDVRAADQCGNLQRDVSPARSCPQAGTPDSRGASRASYVEFTVPEGSQDEGGHWDLGRGLSR